jgi:flagellar biosynthesis protein FlhA
MWRDRLGPRREVDVAGPQTADNATEGRGDFLLAIGVVGLLFVMMVPLPPVLLDMLLAASVSFAMLLFLTAIYARKPVEFSVFPILLLVATVFRLALNVASTRLILLRGGDGSAAAGKVIEAFGQFVVGGNYAVGTVVFIILVVINFVVITKGAGRVAEVAARFTLDALPGKQMAIDAELNAGIIDETVAKARRSEITREADFYGAMDGASKFIRGDAIAGVVITLVNVIGGIFIGTIQQGMPVEEAVQTYLILTIGDGLAGQVPALVVSTAAGLLVTRVADITDRPLHAQVAGQLLSSGRVLWLASLSVALFATIPGLRVPFAVMAMGLAALAFRRGRMDAEPERPAIEAPPTTPHEAGPEDLLDVQPLAIEVAVDLLYLVDARQGGELLQRIQKVRKQFAKDAGLVLPLVHLRDNMRIGNGEYRIMLRGEVVGSGRLYPRQHLALDPGTAAGKIKGIAANDPIFGLPAWWILDHAVLRAQALGYTVVDVPTILTTHFVELMHQHGHELLDNAQLDKRLDQVAKTNARLVEDLVPDPLPRTSVLRVLRNLVREGLSIRDTTTILEALGEYASKSSDPDVLTEFVRQKLARHITHRYTDDDGAIHVVGLGPRAEDAVLRALQSADGRAPMLMLEPNTARVLITRIREHVESYPGPGSAVVLCPPLARGAFRRLLERVLPRIPVISSAELLATAQLQTVGIVDLDKSLKPS